MFRSRYGVSVGLLPLWGDVERTGEAGDALFTARREPMLLHSHILAAPRYALVLRNRRRRGMSFNRRKSAFYRAYWAHAAESVGAQLVDRGDDLLEIRRNTYAMRVRYHEVDLDTFFEKRLVDDKVGISRLVRELGFRSPRFACYSLNRMDLALEFFARVRAPCVVKPATGRAAKALRVPSIAVDDSLMLRCTRARTRSRCRP